MISSEARARAASCRFAVSATALSSPPIASRLCFSFACPDLRLGRAAKPPNGKKVPRFCNLESEERVAVSFEPLFHFEETFCESATVTQFVCTARDVGSLAARLRARYEARARQFFLLNLIHEDAVPSNRRSPRVQANSRSPKLVGMSTSLHRCEPQPWTSVPLPSAPQS